jgi:hypothetical protein
MTQAQFDRDIVLHYKGCYYSLDGHDWRPKPVAEPVQRRAAEAIDAGLRLGRLPATEESDTSLAGATCYVADLSGLADDAALANGADTWIALNNGTTLGLDLQAGQFVALPEQLRPVVQRAAGRGMLTGRLVDAPEGLGTLCTLLNLDGLIRLGCEANGASAGEIMLHRQGRYFHLVGPEWCVKPASEDLSSAAELALHDGATIGCLCVVANIGSVATLVDLDGLGEASTILIQNGEGSVHELSLDQEQVKPVPSELLERARLAWGRGTEVGFLQGDARFGSCYLLDVAAFGGHAAKE